MSRCEIKLTIGPTHINQSDWVWSVIHFMLEIDEFFETESSDKLYDNKVVIVFDAAHKAKFTEFMLTVPIADFNLTICNVEIVEIDS